MKTSIERVGDFSLIQLSGKLDPLEAERLDTAIEGEITGSVKYLLFDLTELQYVGSIGLRSFVATAKRVNAMGGACRFCGISGEVKQVFDLTKLSTQLPVYSTRPEAMKGFPPQ